MRALCRVMTCSFKDRASPFADWQYIYFLSCLILFSFFTVIQLSCPHFPPITLPCPTYLQPPTFDPPPLLSLSLDPLYMFLDLTLPLLSPLSPFPLASGHVSLFFISRSLVVFCSFVLLIRFHL